MDALIRAWLAIPAFTIIALAGCLAEPIPDDATPPISPDLQRFEQSHCQYHEALVTISAADASQLIPAGYTPTNGLTGDDSTALLFVPYLGCDEEVVLVGITIEEPADAPGESELNGFLLGAFAMQPGGNISKLFSAPVDQANITFTDGTTSSVVVEDMLSMTATHAARNDALSSTPFSIRLYHEIAGARQTVLFSAGDLERENSVGTYQSGPLFGNSMPDGVPLVYAGSLSDVLVERLE